MSLLSTYLQQPSGCISERRVITDLLIRYKQHACLWNTSNPLYSSKSARQEAYSDLLEIYKLLVKDANAVSLRKKIELLRTSYRREYKKALINKDHKPSLWYYNLLLFLNESPEKGSADGRVIQTEDIEYDDEVSRATEYLDYEIQGNITDELKMESSDPEQTETKTFKQSFVDPNYEQSSFLLRSDDLTEAGAFGRTLGLQLSELTLKQKIIAQKLISDVIFYGRLEKLTTQTTFVNLNDVVDDDDD